MGKVDFGGVLKEACLAYVPEAEVGDYVIVHAGFANQPPGRRRGRKSFRVPAGNGRAESTPTEMPARRVLNEISR